MNCSGTESWLRECKKTSSWGNTSQCNGHARDVGVKCNVPDVYYGQKKMVSGTCCVLGIIYKDDERSIEWMYSDG